MSVERLWGSRLQEKSDEDFIRFISGRDVRGLPPCDESLIPYDLWGSRAHAVMLWKQGIISREDTQILVKGLHEIAELYAHHTFSLNPAREDVHSNIETFLIEKYGLTAGGKLHTARSRNDQVALDTALFLREKNLEFFRCLLTLQNTALPLATRHAATVIPGYSHHQHAMVTTLGHLLFSFGESFYRDLLRLKQWHTLFNVNPLGAAAGYGTSFPIDRELTSLLLGFDQPSSSSLDPVTNRWEAEAELGYALSMTMNHLSGLAQTLILFTTTEFGFVTLSDKYCAGSSIMPQKRNASGLEVIKAKSAVVHGLLSSLLSLGRGLFVGYNQESQWTKYLIMDALAECGAAPLIMAAILETLSVNETKARELCQQGFITATDLMEALVSEFAIPLREGKVLVEKAVKYSESEGAETVSYDALCKALDEMNLRVPISPGLVEEWQEPAAAVKRREAIGGTAPKVVTSGVEQLTAHVLEMEKWLKEKENQIQTARKRLEEIEKALFQNQL